MLKIKMGISKEWRKKLTFKNSSDKILILFCLKEVKIVSV